jgi:hypothetical protein
VVDDTWLRGDVGLWARGFNEAISVEFRSARVWTADE